MVYHKPHNTTKRTGTGGKKGRKSDKRLSQVGSQPLHPSVSDKDVRKKQRVRGGRTKIRLKKSVSINVVSDGKTVKVKVLSVLESENKDYVRANILTKGAIVQTDKFPKVKITSRPSQHGVLNGVVVKE